MIWRSTWNDVTHGVRDIVTGFTWNGATRGTRDIVTSFTWNLDD